MKLKLFVCMLATTAMVMAGCGSKAQQSGVCHIKGTAAASCNGKRIFLVPLFGPKTAEYVDSVVVENGQFEFTKDTVMMAKILMDYHYRLGIQTLLVATDPGEVEVTIDSISSAKGTPLNDTLQAWKELTEQHNRELGPLNYAVRMLKQKNDTAQAAVLEKQARAMHVVYKKQTRQLAATMEGTVLGDFLKDLYPLTYKRKMADGSIVTFDADTDEPISE